MSITVYDVALLAAEAHKGQVRQFSGEPYIRHPYRVAAVFSDPICIMAALLHDTLEDTSVTAEDLREAGVPEAAIEVVQIVTRGDETYRDFITRIANKPEEMPVETWVRAREVKRADVRDNLRDLPEGNRLRSRYEAALAILGN